MTARFCRAPFCITRVSAASADGLCDECRDDQARLARQQAAPGAKHCRVCGGPYYKDGRCHQHFNQYHQQRYLARKAERGELR